MWATPPHSHPIAAVAMGDGRLHPSWSLHCSIGTAPVAMATPSREGGGVEGVKERERQREEGKPSPASLSRGTQSISLAESSP